MDSVLSFSGEMVLVTSVVPPDPGIMALSHSAGGRRGTQYMLQGPKNLFDSGNFTEWSLPRALLQPCCSGNEKAFH